MYTCTNWELVKQFHVATNDLEDIAWSPDTACLAAWDNSLTYNLVVVTPEGETLATYSAYSNALGIKTVQWSPSGQMLSIGSFDQVAVAVQHNQTQPWNCTWMVSILFAVDIPCHDYPHLDFCCMFPRICAPDRNRACICCQAVWLVSLPAQSQVFSTINLCCSTLHVH